MDPSVQRHPNATQTHKPLAHNVTAVEIYIAPNRCGVCQWDSHQCRNNDFILLKLTHSCIHLHAANGNGQLTRTSMETSVPISVWHCCAIFVLNATQNTCFLESKNEIIEYLAHWNMHFYIIHSRQQLNLPAEHVLPRTANTIVTKKGNLKCELVEGMLTKYVFIKMTI